MTTIILHRSLDYHSDTSVYRRTLVGHSFLEKSAFTVQAFPPCISSLAEEKWVSCIVRRLIAHSGERSSCHVLSQESIDANYYIALLSLMSILTVDTFQSPIIPNSVDFRDMPCFLGPQLDVQKTDGNSL